MDQKQLILAALLSLAVLLGWSLLFPPPTADREPATAPLPAPQVDTESPAPVGAPAPAEPASAETEPEPAEPAEAISASAEVRVEVDGEIGRAVFSNRGAQLLSYRLKSIEGRDGQPLEMVRARARGPYPFALVDGTGASSPLNQALFASEGPETGADGRSRVVRFRYSGEAGAATKEFRFRPDGMIELSIEVGGIGPWGVVLGPGLRNPNEAELKSRQLFRGASVFAAGALDTHTTQKLREPVEVGGTGFRWVALEDTYFLSMLAPRTPVQGALLVPMLIVPGEEGAAASFERRPPPDLISDQLADLHQDIEAAVLPQGPALEAVAYWGPKRYSALSSPPLSSFELARTVRWGWFGFLARPMLGLLLWIHDHVVASFGWAIVILTCLIKLVLLPLTHKSYVSMQKMQKLQPKIEAIKQKYRGKQRDKQGRPNLESQRKMNEEMQELFRVEGVNPAGGCLPMLLQMPVFFSIFALLRNSVELWNAPWLLWIRDLSAPDPWYVLPIVMGLAQFLQQRMTPMSAATNPAQRIMLNTMPIWFTVISFGFPSGLVLYWLTNNVTTILQQGIYQRLKKAGYLGGPDALTPAPAVRKERAQRAKKR